MSDEPPGPSGNRQPGEPDWQKRYTILGLRFSQGQLWMTAIGVVVAVASVVVALVQLSDEPTTRQQNNNTLTAGYCSQLGDVNNCSVQVQERLSEIDARAKNDAEFREEVAKMSNIAPPSRGPWPFVVIGTRDIGLKIRSNGERDGKQIGSAANRSVLWADCLATTSFEPDPVVKAGPKWLRVR